MLAKKPRSLVKGIGIRVARAPVTLMRWLGASLKAVDSYASAVTALATVVLSVITGIYLLEVREQRFLTYKQLALQNRPDISITGLSPLVRKEGILQTFTNIQNDGGPAQRVRTVTVLLCCGEAVAMTEAAVQDLDLNGRSYFVNRLGKGKGRNFYMGLTGDLRQSTLPYLDRGTFSLWAHVIVQYTRPASPVEKEAELEERASFYWNGVFQEWMSVPEVVHRAIGEIVDTDIERQEALQRDEPAGL